MDVGDRVPTRERCYRSAQQNFRRRDLRIPQTQGGLPPQHQQNQNYRGNGNNRDVGGGGGGGQQQQKDANGFNGEIYKMLSPRRPSNVQ